MSQELDTIKGKARALRQEFDELMRHVSWSDEHLRVVDHLRTAITDLYAPKPDMEVTRRLIAAKTMEPEKAEPADIVRQEADDDLDDLIENRCSYPRIHEQRRCRALELALEHARQRPLHDPLDTEEVIKTAARFAAFLRSGKAD